MLAQEEVDGLGEPEVLEWESSDEEEPWERRLERPSETDSEAYDSERFDLNESDWDEADQGL